VSHEPCLEANADVFREAFEVGRRFKGMNPDKMRASYGKLIYMLQASWSRDRATTTAEAPTRGAVAPCSQDATAPDVIRELGFDPLSRVQTVHAELALLSCLDLLEEPELPLAASPAHSAEAADAKAAATARLLARFADGDAERAVRLERCLLSLADHACLVEAHVSPVDAMLRLLRTHFSPASTSVGPGGAASASLQITAGRGAPRAVASLRRLDARTSACTSACTSVVPSPPPRRRAAVALARVAVRLRRAESAAVAGGAGVSRRAPPSSSPSSGRGVPRRRRAVLAQLPRMWALAEKDLLSGGYRLRDTGQGRHRVQSAPNVGQLMSEVLRRLQAEQGGGWVGSSAVHLGDDDVPNALVWVDKYSQVPRILGPIAHAVSQSTLDSLAAKPGVRGYIVSAFGSAEACRLAVLADFFKHGFDGSGADNFFDAGSCIDGRLTSAWHFCARLSKKPYYPLFQMSGFVGFDGAFGRR